MQMEMEKEKLEKLHKSEIKKKLHYFKIDQKIPSFIKTRKKL